MMAGGSRALTTNEMGRLELWIANLFFRLCPSICWRGFEVDLEQVDDWLGQFEKLITFGRQGLFAHDNAHHALYMAYCAVDCMQSNGGFQWDQWKEFRHEFESHVVED